MSARRQHYSVRLTARVRWVWDVVVALWTPPFPPPLPPVDPSGNDFAKARQPCGSVASGRMERCQRGAGHANTGALWRCALSRTIEAVGAIRASGGRNRAVPAVFADAVERPPKLRRFVSVIAISAVHVPRTPGARIVARVDAARHVCGRTARARRSTA